MPVYEYECSECGVMTEIHRSLTECDAPLDCPKCGGQTKKIISGTSFKINGYSEENGYSNPKLADINQMKKR